MIELGREERNRLKAADYPSKCPSCSSSMVDVTPEGIFHCKRCGYRNNSKARQ